MKQIIFICGPDMTGKTQIAKALSQRLNVPYFKATSEHDSYKLSANIHTASRLPENAFLMQLQHADPRVLDLFKQCKFNVVMDRGFPCERVYSRVFKRQTNEKMIEHLDEHWAALGARIIICTRSSYEGIIDDIDPRIDSKRLQQLDDEYKLFSQETKCKCLLLNVDDENLDRELSDITNWIEWTK